MCVFVFFVQEMAFPCLPRAVKDALAALSPDAKFCQAVMADYYRLRACGSRVRSGSFRRLARHRRCILPLWQISGSQFHTCLTQWLQQEPVDLFVPCDYSRDQTICIEMNPESWTMKDTVSSCRFAIPHRISKFMPFTSELVENRDIIILADDIMQPACIQFVANLLFTAKCHVIVLNQATHEFLAEHPEWARNAQDYATHVNLPGAEKTYHECKTDEPVNFLFDPFVDEAAFVERVLEVYRTEQGHAGQNLFVPYVTVERILADFFSHPGLSYRTLYELMSKTRNNSRTSANAFWGFAPADLVYDTCSTVVYENEKSGGKILLGGVHHAHLGLLNLLGVTSILSVGSTQLNPYLLEAKPDLDITEINLPDDGNTSCISILQEVVELLKKKVIENGETMLVHCHRGISRSAALIMAFYMAVHNLSMEQAFERLHKRRLRVCPTRRLQMDLLLLEKLLWPDQPRRTLSLVWYLR
jgi:hypothetical protein